LAELLNALGMAICQVGSVLALEELYN